MGGDEHDTDQTAEPAQPTREELVAQMTRDRELAEAMQQAAAASQALVDEEHQRGIHDAALERIAADEARYAQEGADKVSGEEAHLTAYDYFHNPEREHEQLQAKLADDTRLYDAVHQESLTSQHLLETEQRYGVSDDYLTEVTSEYAQYEQHGADVVAADQAALEQWEAAHPQAAEGAEAPAAEHGDTDSGHHDPYAEQPNPQAEHAAGHEGDAASQN